MTAEDDEHSKESQKNILDALRKKKQREKKERLEAEREERREQQRKREQQPKYVIIVPHPKTGVLETVIDYPTYADFLKEKFSTVYFKGLLYVYDYDECLYRKHDNEIGTHIQQTMDNYGVKKSFAHILNEILLRLKNKGSFAEYPFNQYPDKIPVENGIIQLNYDDGTVELLEHSPEYRFTYKLAATYDPTISSKNIIKLFDQWVDPEKSLSLLQIPAQALLQMQTGHSYKKSHILQGEPHAGKTSYLTLLTRFFTSNNIAAIRLQQICEDRFVGGNLEGKLLNLYDDLEDIPLSTIDAFKTLTGSCTHGVERKYQEAYVSRVTAVHVFSCNFPPEYPEKVKRDAAFWERWEYLKFPNQYPVDPTFYDREYTDELFSSLLNAIIWAMVKIKKEGMLVKSGVQEVMMNWDINSDPLYEFIAWGFSPGDNKTLHKYSKEKMYQAYHNWCNERNTPEHKRKQGITAFSRALQSHNFVPTQQKEKTKTHEVYASVTHRANPATIGDLTIQK